MLASDVAIIDIKEHHIKHFKVIIELLREATCLPNASTQLVSETAIVIFYAYVILLTDLFVIRFECGYKTVSVIHTNRAIADFQLLKTSF